MQKKKKTSFAEKFRIFHDFFRHSFFRKKRYFFLKKGFTLIELIIAITIIGILATGISIIYTSAKQKARDVVRQIDVITIQKALEKAYGDDGEYPPGYALYSTLIGRNYLFLIPSDPKTGEDDGEAVFVYVYASAADEETRISGQEYEISANYENPGNALSKEGMDSDFSGEGNGESTTNDDNGNDGIRWEIGINTDHVNTDIDTIIQANRADVHSVSPHERADYLRQVHYLRRLDNSVIGDGQNDWDGDFDNDTEGVAVVIDGITSDLDSNIPWNNGNGGNNGNAGGNSGH